MSDVPAGSMSLEDAPPPPPEPVVENPPPPAAAAPPPNPEDADPEGTVVNPGGEKLVPLSVVSALRGELRTVKGEVASLKPKAERADEVLAEWQRAQPIIQKARELVSATPPPPKPAGPLSEQEAVDYARELDLFTPEGKPDTARAQRIAARQEALADRRAQTHIAPLVQHTAAEQARMLKQQISQTKDANGHTVGQQYIDQVYASLPPEAAAMPQIANLAYYAAKGLEAHQGKGRSAPPPPPVVTDSLGGSAGAPVSLTAIDHAFRTAADMPEKQFLETRERYQPGRVNSLE